MKEEYAVETKGLCKTYGNTDAVSQLNMRVKTGAVYGLIDLTVRVSLPL